MPKAATLAAGDKGVRMKAKIKVVKRDQAQQLKAKDRVRKAKPAPAQDMVTTVTGWVADVKQRKNKETKTAFDMLFSSTPRPSES